MLAGSRQTKMAWGIATYADYFAERSLQTASWWRLLVKRLPQPHNIFCPIL